MSEARLGARARAWWESLQPREKQKGDRVALARLRRAGTLAEAMAEEATIQLFREMGGGNPNRLPRVAVIAMVLAHVREDDPPGEGGGRRPAIAAVGRKPDNAEGAKMSEVRFRRLLACRENEELVTHMRRLVILAGQRINVADLAQSLWWWNDWTRARWAFEYYAAGAAAPAPSADEPAWSLST